MFDPELYLYGLAAISVAALITWIVSLAKRDVSIVDSLWAVLSVSAAATYVALSADTGPRAAGLLVLVALWAIRLSGYITWRNWGQNEDHRYQAIRRRNEPYFGIKSLYLIFGFQGVLAWIVSLPLLAAVISSRPLGLLDAVGVALWGIGMAFETLADWQMARFRAQSGTRAKVLDSGLWRYSRHPNYFGEFCVWWGFYAIALSAGGWWSIVSPLLMTFLLLKFSGVALLERDIADRRPRYSEYIARTNAFFPGPRRRLPQEASR